MSQILSITLSYTQGSRELPLVFDALGDPLGMFFPPLSCFLVLDALGFSQLSLPVFAETLPSQPPFYTEIFIVFIVTVHTPIQCLLWACR